MPPLHKPLKNDGPLCRVCGCSEHNACVIHTDETFTERIAKNVRLPATRMPRLLTCSWVKVEGSTSPLCSSCSGSPEDMAEAIARGCRMLTLHSTAGINMAVVIGKAALARRKRREKSEKGT